MGEGVMGERKWGHMQMIQACRAVLLKANDG